MKIQRMWQLLIFLAIVFILVAIVLKMSSHRSHKLSKISGTSNTRQVVVSGELLPQQLQQQIERNSKSDTQSAKYPTTNDTREGLEEFIMWLEALDKPVDKQDEDPLDWKTNWPATGRYYARDYLNNVLEDSQWREFLQTKVSANPDFTFKNLDPSDPNSGVMLHAPNGTVIPSYQLYSPSGVMTLKAEWLFGNPIDTNSDVTRDFSDGYDRSHDLDSSEFAYTEKTAEMRDEPLITVTPKKRVTQKMPIDDDGESEISREGKSDQLTPPEAENVWHLETGEGSGGSVQMEREDEPIGMDDKLGPEDDR